MSIKNIVKTTVTRTEYPVFFDAESIGYRSGGYVGRWTNQPRDGFIGGPRFKMSRLSESTSVQYGFQGKDLYSIKVPGKTTRYFRGYTALTVDGETYSVANLWALLNS